MGLLNWFGGKERDTPRSNSGMILTPPAPPVVRYVNALLNGLCEHGGPLALASDKALPRPHGGGDPPTYTQATNRLKVLSGLNPAPCATPTSAEIEHRFRGRAYRVELQFHDATEKGTCQIRSVP